MSVDFAIEEDAPGVGHNSGSLAERHRDLSERLSELQGALAKVPATIADDVTQAKVGDLAKLMTKLASTAKASHKTEKEPHLEAGRQVDAFFLAGIIKPLDEAKSDLERRSTAYLRRKEAAERARREAEERAAREAAEAAAAAASTEADLSDAITKEAEAVQAAEAAAAPVAELVRTRGALGSVTTARKEWFGEIEDFDEIPLDGLRAFIARAEIERAVKAFVKAGGRSLRGVRIYEDIKVGFR